MKDVHFDCTLPNYGAGTTCHTYTRHVTANSFFPSFPHPSPKLQRKQRLSLELRLKDILEGLAVGGKLSDTLVQLVEGHLVVEQRPAERVLVVNVGDLGKRVGALCCSIRRQYRYTFLLL